ncbi:MAG: sn-glycerol-3-phosphate ABC transporter ATP-binding protein UgpC [Elusimicrobia bacterium]|nr:sn-glycerol-3-phosphate ABC transporter ATP-binding protein UgpC [Elusimicrobiota bacterium]
MAEVKLNNVSKVFSGNVNVINELSIEVKDKEFFILVGPSGCGKSTLLRMIAGLERPTGGEVLIDGQVVNDIPSKDRDIAMVFQNYALYPHMTVYENLGFSLKRRKYPSSEIKQRIHEAAALLKIEHLLDRKPRLLSGGQQQRVAVGKAIVRKPKVFLLDEPLSNLDAKLRVHMRAELKILHSKLQATVIYVTHDQVEAMTMGDRVVVMKDGSIQQIGNPSEIYNKPNNIFVAGFVGAPSMNIMRCKIIAKNSDILFDFGEFELKVPPRFVNTLKTMIGKEVDFGIRSEDIYDRLYAEFSTTDNTVWATVEHVEPMGMYTFLYLTLWGHKIIIRVESYNRAQMHQDIQLVFDMDKIHLFDSSTGKVITP